jgi:two-component system sensor histidine kinase DegS
VLRMDILSKVCEKDTTRIPTELARMKEIAQGALDEIRGFIFDLRPMTLQDLGLVATIKRVVQSMREMANLNVRFVVDGDERPLGQLVNLAVFRIAQEALNNIRKYADCRTAWVHLKYLDHKVILIVEDDGAGFDVNEVANSQKKYATYGLLGMQERADDIGATLEVSSAPRDGTKVVLVVPTDHNPAIDTELDEEAHKSENEQ